MLIGEVGDFAATRGALYEAFLDEIRLIYFLESARVFAESSGDGGEANGTALELVDDCGENLVVDFVKAILVDIQGFEGESGD